MGPITKECEGKIIREGNRRLVAIPDEFFLEGENVIIRQERDGAITIHPADEDAREAMWSRFNPFVEWPNDTWPKETPVWDEEQAVWLLPSPE